MLATMIIIVFAATCWAEPSGMQTSDDRTISRYLSLLEKRPVTGTAFDRVFNYYRQNGGIDQLLERLKQPSKTPQIQTSRQLLLGMVYVRSKDSQQAIQALQLVKQQLAQQQRPPNPVIDDQLAQAWMLQSQFSKAAAAWELALAHTTNRTTSFDQVQQLVTVYKKLRQHDRAIAVLEKFDQQFPGDPEIQELLTAALIDSGQTETAIQRLTQQLSTARSSAERLKLESQRADLLLRCGQEAKAVAAYQAILEQLNPQSWQATELDQKLQQILARQPNSNALFTYLNQRLKADPASSQKRLQLIRFLQRSKKHQDSLNVASEAPDGTQESAEFLRAAIIDYTALNQFDEVEATFQRLESSGSLSPRDVIRWGQIAYDRSEHDQKQRTTNAIQRWEKLLTVFAADVPTWQKQASLAKQLAAVGLRAEAAEYFSKAVDGNGAPADTFCDYAELLIQQGEVQSAVSRLRRLVDREASTSADIKQAIDTLKAAQQFRTAAEFGGQLVQRDPTVPNRLLFAEVLLQDNNFTTADLQLQKILALSDGTNQNTTRQQVVDLLTKTGFASTKASQLLKTDDLKDSDRLLLTLLLEFQGDLSQALQAVAEISTDSPLATNAKERQAVLQQKAGQLREAEATYQALLSLAPRKSAEYREAIQHLQLQMGRTEDAYQTAQSLFQTSPESASSVMRYVNFLKGNDRRVEATSVLTTFLEQQDTSAELMIELADLFAAQFRSDEALVWLWKALEKSTSESIQRDIANRIVTVALRKNQTFDVLERLKKTVNQNTWSSAAHRTLLMADAYRQANQLPTAVLELQDFLSIEGSSNVELLTELVDLLGKLGRTDEAVEYQFQLAVQEPTQPMFQRLAELLHSHATIEGYESRLRQLSSFNEWRLVALDLVDQWFAANRTQAANQLLNTLNQSSQSNQSDWKLQLRKVHSDLLLNGQQQGVAAAVEFCGQRVSAEQLLRMAMANRSADFYSADSFEIAQLNTGHLSVVQGMELANSGQSCEIDKRWQVQNQRLETADDDAIAFAKDTIFLHSAKQLTSSGAIKVAEKMAEKQTSTTDVAAFSILLSVANPKRASAQLTPAWNRDNVRLVFELLRRLQSSETEVLSADMIRYVHQVLVDSNLTAEASVIRSQFIPKLFQQGSQQLADSWKIAEETRDLSLAHLVLDEWIQLSKGFTKVSQSGNRHRNPSSSVSPAEFKLPRNFGQSMALFGSLGSAPERVDLLQKFLLLKAASLSSTGRFEVNSNRPTFDVRWTTKGNHRIFKDGRHVGSRNIVTLPETTFLQTTDITFLLNLILGLTAAEQETLSDFAIQAARQQADQTTQVLYQFTAAHLLCLQSRFDEAILQLIDAASVDPQTGSLRLLIAAYHVDNGHSLAALNLLKTISSSDVAAYQQALWLTLQIGGSSGQALVAEHAAEALLGTRLSQAERRHLAFVTQTGGSKQQPPRTKPSSSQPGGRMESFVDQMHEMQKTGQVDQAMEIASSILLSSHSNQHASTMTSSGIQSAITLLAEYKQLEPMLNDVNRRLEQNKQSIVLLRLKFQILQGMERVQEAAEVQQLLAAFVPDTAEQQIQDAAKLEDDRRYSDAVDLYVKAFQRAPSLLLADYYHYFKVFRRVDRLPEISDLLLQSDLQKLREHYFVVSELIDILLSQSDSTAVGRRSIQSGFQLLDAAWVAYPSDREYLLNNIQAKRLWESQQVVNDVFNRLIPHSKQQAFARPWLGLDAKPVQIDGVGKLCSLQRVLLHLHKDEARDQFLQQVVTARQSFPDWLAGPYIEIALTIGTNRDPFGGQKLVALIDSAIHGNGDKLPTEIAAVNLAAIFRNSTWLVPIAEDANGNRKAADTQIVDRRLAELLAAVISDQSRSTARAAAGISFVDSTEYLLAQLQCASADFSGGRKTVLKMIGTRASDSEQAVDAESARRRIQDVLTAVKLLRSANLRLDAVNVSKQVTPRLLTVSQNDQANDSLSFSCRRMWQQASRDIQTATATDVLAYLAYQMQDVDAGLSRQWDLMINPPTWKDNVRWKNSDLLTILRRIGASNSQDVETIFQALTKAKGDDFSASLCQLALSSSRRDSRYQNAVQAFLNRFSADTTPPNSLLAWCLVHPSVNQTQQVKLSSTQVQRLLNLSLHAAESVPEFQIWKHCIANEAAGILLSSGKTTDATAAWTNALNSVVPAVTKQIKTDRSPLQETRRLLLAPE